MENYVQQMIDEGWDFPRLAAACTRAMAVEHTYREVSTSHDTEIAEGLKRINELLLLTDEQARERQETRIAELEARQRKVWEQSVRVDAMRHQVEAWEPGENEDAQGLKRFMLGELDRGPNERLLEIHQQGLDTIEAMTPREYLEKLYQAERRSIQSHEQAKEIEEARAAEWRAWRATLATAGIELDEKQP